MATKYDIYEQILLQYSAPILKSVKLSSFEALHAQHCLAAGVLAGALYERLGQ